MIPTKSMTPYVPISVDEIVEDVLNCVQKGVSIVHLHARDRNEAPTYKKEVYAQIISKLRKMNRELIICVSTSGRNFSEFDKRSDVLHLTGDCKPDMASLTLGSFNFVRGVSCNSPETIINLAKMMKEKNIKPEMEIFDLGMVNYAKYLIGKNLIDPPYYFNIILGNVSGAQPALLHAGLIISELPTNSYYTLTAIGNSQAQMNAIGVIIAHGVRVGLEDNIWYDAKRNRLATNLAMVERIVQLANILERPIACAQEVRSLLAIKTAGG